MPHERMATRFQHPTAGIGVGGVEILKKSYVPGVRSTRGALEGRAQRSCRGVGKVVGVGLMVIGLLGCERIPCQESARLIEPDRFDQTHQCHLGRIELREVKGLVVSVCTCPAVKP
jgi:hypothetical protein